MSEALDWFGPQQLNTIPFAGSWTAGQVAEHIIKSVSELPDEKTETPKRFEDEKVYLLKKIFLDFTTKMKSPDFIVPQQTTHDKAALLQSLTDIEDNLIRIIKTKDLSLLCLDFEFPSVGYLTRLEWIKFFIFHTQRHTRQIVNIYNHLTGQ